MVTRQIDSPWEFKRPLSTNAVMLDPIAVRDAASYEQLWQNKPLLEQQLRQQLARELHDGPVQTMSNVTMQLMVLQKQLTADPRAAQQELQNVIGSMQRAVKEMRCMMSELRPLTLERDGLIPALREFVSHLRERHEIDIQFDAAVLDLDLPPVVQTNLYYIIQEAAQNTLKHARANHLRIALNTLSDELQVFISDDGQGFNLTQVQSNYSDRQSLGLLNLSERAQLIHGQLTLYSNVGQGTIVHLSVPLH